MYSTKLGGRVEEFGTSGFLYRSNKLMYDRTTNSLWNQFTGEPAVGTLVGQKGSGTAFKIEFGFLLCGQGTHDVEQCLTGDALDFRRAFFCQGWTQ